MTTMHSLQELPDVAPPASVKPSHEQVATFAYLIWEREGRSHGHDVDDWLTAEKHLESPALTPQPVLPEG